MPYTENDPKLPDRIKALPARKRRQWINVWNSVYERCQAAGGEACEASAFQQANGVIAKAGRYDHIDFKPPRDVQAAARRGLEWRRKYGRGGLSAQEASAQGIGSGVQRATNLANGDTISPDTIRRMVSFFARHEKNKGSRTDSGEPGAGMIAWELWGGDPGRRWAEKVKEQMDRADKGIAKMINVDGLNISLEDILAAMKQPQGGQREMLRQAQAERAKKYGIKAQEGAPLTVPARFVRMGAKLDDLADRVNLRFLIWLTKSPDSLTPAQLAQVRNAPARFAQFKDRYDPASRAAVEMRIDEALKKFKVGRFAEKEESLAKAWHCQVIKQDEERRLAYSVALKASGGVNGLRPDSQRDVLSSQEVEAAAHRFMLESRTFDLHHKKALPQTRAAVVESYLAPVDFQAGQTQVKAGDWIVAVKVHDGALWQDIKAGKINAFSIRGVGKRRPLKSSQLT